jgi:thioredoxin 1
MKKFATHFLLCGLLFAGLVRAASPATPGRPRLVDLGADKCIPCKLMAPILEELKKEYAGRLDVVFIDVWKDREAGKPYGISVIPTQIFYDASGKERFRHEGFFSKQEILKKFQEIGVDLSAGKSAGIIREKPAAADTRPRDRVCSRCDGDVDAKACKLGECK